MTGALKKAAGFSSCVSSDADCWAAYRETGDIRYRNELVLHYARLVEIIARKMYGMFAGKAQLEDIIGNGMIALIKAVESYDPTRDTKFETYASIRIRGSVVDYIRSQDWVPRSTRAKAREIESAYARLREQQHREPSIGDIAQELGLKPEEVETILTDTHRSHVLSLDEFLADRWESTDIEDADKLPPSMLLMQKELKQVLARAIDSLTEKQRMVISLFYYEELKIKEIAEVMGITPPRVCQLHSMALLKIKAEMKEYMTD